MPFAMLSFTCWRVSGLNFYFLNLMAMNLSLIFRISLGAFALHASSHAVAQSAERKTNLSAVSQVISTTTVNALSNSYLSSMMGGMGVFRWRLGDAGEAGPRGGLAAAAEDSPWSLWATPVRSTFNNNILPITSQGAVTLAIAGIEYRDEGPWMGGVTVSLDQLAATTQTLSAGTATGAELRGHGYTLAPYLVYQMTPMRAIDMSIGAGQSNLDYVSASKSTKPVDHRRLASVGITDMHEWGKAFVMLKANYNVTLDRIAASTGADDDTMTRLNQARVGAQLMYPGETFSPFVAHYRLFNTLRASGGDTQPVEYSATGQWQLGLNMSSGGIFGALVAQRERDRHQMRLYVGYRY